MCCFLKTLLLALQVTFDGRWIRKAPMNFFGVAGKYRAYLAHPITDGHNVIKGLPCKFVQMLHPMLSQINAYPCHCFNSQGVNGSWLAPGTENLYFVTT